MATRQIIIIKNDHIGREVWRYPGRVIDQSREAIVVEAFFNRKDLQFNGVLLKEGDRFIEYYSKRKWFNIYEIFDRDDLVLKAYYCNVTHPPTWSDSYLQYDDLALDLLVFPDGRQLALDEDEFLKLELSDIEIANARQAMIELENIFSSNRPEPISSCGIRSVFGWSQEEIPD